MKRWHGVIYMGVNSTRALFLPVEKEEVTIQRASERMR